MPSDQPSPSHRHDVIRRLRGLFGRREESLRDRVEELIDAPDEMDADARTLGPHERALLGNVLKLRGATAYDVMVPRADIVALPSGLTLEQALAAVGRQAPFNMRAILRKPLLVVPSVPVLDLLLRMREARIHMALVIDEYGGIDGLVTIEDLVETIVGDIADEHDEIMGPQIVERGEGVMEVDARTEIETFEEKLGPILTEEERSADIDTVGGLVLTLAGRVPARGEIFTHSSGLEFRVLDADARRIRRLRVRRPAADGAEAAAAE